MKHARELLEAIRRATRESTVSHTTTAVAYSGGLDSSVVARLASETTEVRCYAASVAGSADARHVAEYASADDFAVEMIVIDPDDMRAHVRTASAAIGTTDPVRIAYTIPVLAVLDASEEACVLTGGGADELFAGYSKYASEDQPALRMSVDLEKAISELYSIRIYANKLDKVLAAPYAHEGVVSLAARIPMAEKLSADGRKLVLREAGRVLGLRAADRPKRAAQYSSGVMKCMRRSAKAEGLSLRQWVEAVLASPD